MSDLLHIEASPRGPSSTSSAAAAGFVAAMMQREDIASVDHLNVWEEALPQFDGAALAAKYALLAGAELDAEQAYAWRRIAAIVDRLRAARRILISTPMWNLGIPYRLKHDIDLVTQPGLTFSFDPASGYTALLSPRPVLVILSSAGDFAQGPSWGRPDLARPYLKAALRFIGLPPTHLVAIGPTAGPSDIVTQARQRGFDQLAQIASAF